MDSSVVQSLGCVRLFKTPWTVACLASLSLTISQNLSKFLSSELMIPSNLLILCYLLLLLTLIFTSIRVFQNESAVRIRWLKYWSFDLEDSFPNTAILGVRLSKYKFWGDTHSAYKSPWVFLYRIGVLFYVQFQNLVLLNVIFLVVLYHKQQCFSEFIYFAYS